MAPDPGAGANPQAGQRGSGRRGGGGVPRWPGAVLRTAARFGRARSGCPPRGGGGALRVGLDLGTPSPRRSPSTSRGAGGGEPGVPMPPLVTAGARGHGRRPGPHPGGGGFGRWRHWSWPPAAVALVAPHRAAGHEPPGGRCGTSVTSPPLPGGIPVGWATPPSGMSSLEEEPALRRTPRGLGPLPPGWRRRGPVTSAGDPGHAGGCSLQGGSWTPMEALLPRGPSRGTPSSRPPVPLGAPVAPLGPGLPDALRGVPFHAHGRRQELRVPGHGDRWPRARVGISPGVGHLLRDPLLPPGRGATAAVPRGGWVAHPGGAGRTL